MIARLPIRVRVTAAFAAVLAAVLAGTGLYVYARVESHLKSALDRDLQLRAQDLSVLVRAPGSSLARETGGRLVERGESYAQLIASDGRIVDATAAVERGRLLNESQRRLALEGAIFVDEPDVPGLNEPSRVLAVPVVRSSRRFVLAVGATRENDVETLASLRDELLLVGPIALIVASLAGYGLAGLSLRQVEAMRLRAAAISSDGAGHRLPVPPTGDELERLGTTLNAMLERLEAAIERERAFMADAGHELRTPLAVLRTELDLALRHAVTADELRDAVRASSDEVERLSRLADDLLLSARTGNGGLALRRERIPVAELLATIERRFSSRAAAKGASLQVERAPADRYVDGDRLRLEQALGNLVDNALRHGGAKISVASALTEVGLELHVCDDGSGFPPGFAAVAFDRFSRAETARSTPGSGLGLAIAKAIAGAHGGSAHIRDVAPRGTDVWLVLPSS